MAGRDLAGDGMVAGGHVQSSVGIFRLFFPFSRFLHVGLVYLTQKPSVSATSPVISGACCQILCQLVSGTT
jgi:hypothetical protein